MYRDVNFVYVLRGFLEIKFMLGVLATLLKLHVRCICKFCFALSGYFGPCNFAIPSNKNLLRFDMM